ncbi:antitoxin [Brucella endophytica]|uniref:Antitoxin n=1 Tax=Brucella endophytica TaxID=1963359 RepID=A0A916S372_9HYPH|nr:type II toxin-antitoxin system HicB family antitoxin [Brucella endophytica]GGA79679.1 antitoxin [Brucella endophytica]
MNYIYHAKLTDDPDGGYLVTFPDVPEAITGGADHAEALRNASEALGLALRGYLVGDRPLPIPCARADDLVPVPVEASDALKLAVIEAFNASGLTKTELARRLGKAETEARRILDPDYPSKLPILQAALAVLGKRVVVSIQDAA